ncbi:MAG: HDIG domain-containing metalloprotein [Candidatus Omnitrophota bacterium]
MKIRPIFESDNNKKKKKKKAEAQKAQKGAQVPAPGVPVSIARRLATFFKRKDTISVLMLLGFLVVALSSMFIAPQMQQWRIREGDVALKDIYAPYDFTYYWGINEPKTAEAREAASEAVPYSVRRNSDIERKAESNLESFFAVVDEEKKTESSIDEKVVSLKEKTKIGLPDKKIRTLLECWDAGELKKKSIDIAGKIFLTGYISEKEYGLLQEKKIDRVVMMDEEGGMEVERAAADLLRENRAEKTIDDYASKEITGDKKVKQAVVSLVALEIEPSLELDEKTTSLKREAAAKNAEPIYNAWDVKKNELIVEKGIRVNAGHIVQLAQIRSIFMQKEPRAYFLGVVLLLLLLIMVAAVYNKLDLKESLLKTPKELAIILLNMLFIILLSDFIIQGPQPSYFIPMASVGMIITLLVGFGPAFISVVLMSVLIAVLAGGKVEIAFVLLTGSMVGIYAIRGARRRANVLWAGLLVGLAKLLAVICAGLINGIEAQVYLKDGFWGIASGVISGFIVLGLLPLFEHFFEVPTDISLLELSDLNHPLLKQLAIEAPGTYHHSIMVGNLAEAASDAIGANSLLARVGSYYHDIGKIPKASYYSENEMGAGSKHAKLTPSMSALIISKHVKEGLEMAEKYKLNSAIRNFISQHHGDSLISFFYQKAIEKAEEETTVNERDFRYPGPKPQTKEAAIVLLADTVEAASRTLDEPTPSSVRNLVKKVINNKFVDEQMDECDLTLQDIHKIAESFVRVLMGIFHTRLDYPEEEEKE